MRHGRPVRSAAEICRPHCSDSSDGTLENWTKRLPARPRPTSERLWPSCRHWHPDLTTNSEHPAVAAGTLPTVRPGRLPADVGNPVFAKLGSGWLHLGIQAVVELPAANARAVDFCRMSGCQPGIAWRFAGMGRAARPPDDEGAISFSADPRERMAAEHQSKPKPAAPALLPAGLPGRDMAAV